MNFRKWIINLTVFIISFSILFYLIKSVQIDELIVNFKKVELADIIILFFLYAGSQFFKGIRLNLFIKSDVIASTLLSSIHNFFNHILPFRSGEILLPVLLKKLNNTGMVSGFTSLLVIRAADLISVFIYFLISLFFYTGLLKNPYYIFLLFIVIVSGLFFLIYIIQIIQFVTSYFEKLQILKMKFINRFINKINISLDEYKKIYSKKISFMNFFITLIIWIISYAFFFYSLISISYNLPFMHSVLASTGAVVTNFLPINGFGSFGTLEAGWTIGYTNIGMPESIAIISGFVMHIIMVFAGFILSIIGFTYFYLKNK